MQLNRPGSSVVQQKCQRVFRVYGLFYDPEFYLIEILIRKLSFNGNKTNSFEFYKLTQTQYDFYFKMLKCSFPDKRILGHERGVPIITCNFQEYITHMGKIVELYSKTLYAGQIYRPPELIGAEEIQSSEIICYKQTQNYFSKPNFVYLSVNVSQQHLLPVPNHFKIVIQLFRDIAPKSCNKFLEMCLAQEMGYTGSQFHRLCKNYFIQGGRADLKSQSSSTVFEDEVKNHIKHDKPGIVGFTNLGTQHSNGVQFYISFDKIQGFDGKTVVIGQVMTGMRELRKINKLQPNSTQKPLYELKIVDSGVYNYSHEDFSTKNKIKRVSTAPILDRKRQSNNRLSQSMSAMPEQASLERCIIESSNFLFEISDSEDECLPFVKDLVYSQSKPSFFNSFFGKMTIQKIDPIDEEDVDDFMPQMSESMSQAQLDSRGIDSKQSSPFQILNSQDIIDSMDIQKSYISGF